MKEVSVKVIDNTREWKLKEASRLFPHLDSEWMLNGFIKEYLRNDSAMFIGRSELGEKVFDKESSWWGSMNLRKVKEHWNPKD